MRTAMWLKTKRKFKTWHCEYKCHYHIVIPFVNYRSRDLSMQIVEHNSRRVKATMWNVIGTTLFGDKFINNAN